MYTYIYTYIIERERVLCLAAGRLTRIAGLGRGRAPWRVRGRRNFAGGASAAGSDVPGPGGLPASSSCCGCPGRSRAVWLAEDAERSARRRQVPMPRPRGSSSKEQRGHPAPREDGRCKSRVLLAQLAVLCLSVSARALRAWRCNCWRHSCKATTSQACPRALVQAPLAPIDQPPLEVGRYLVAI